MAAEETVRLNKFLAQCGLCSRRAADELISRGEVTINGRTAEAGTKVDPTHDQVTVRGKVIGLPRTGSLTIALHKPVQVVTTLHDPQGRATVLGLLPPEIRSQRPSPVGRLDFLSEGLLLLTTDGELCNRLTHPRHHLPKTYRIRVRGNVPENVLKTMRSGMTLAEGEQLAPVQARVISKAKDETTLELVLLQGVNRQIRRMCRDLGFSVLQLMRTAQGPVQLGKLKPGAWRELSTAEVQALRQAVGLA